MSVTCGQLALLKPRGGLQKEHCRVEQDTHLGKRVGKGGLQGLRGCEEKDSQTHRKAGFTFQFLGSIPTLLIWIPLSWFLLLGPTSSEEESWRPILPELSRVWVCRTNHNITLCSHSWEDCSQGDKAPPGSTELQERLPWAQPATAITQAHGINASRKGVWGARRKRQCTPAEWESFVGFLPVFNPKEHRHCPFFSSSEDCRLGYVHHLCYRKLVSHSTHSVKFISNVFFYNVLIHKNRDFNLKVTLHSTLLKLCLNSFRFNHSAFNFWLNIKYPNINST